MLQENYINSQTAAYFWHYIMRRVGTCQMQHPKIFAALCSRSAVVSVDCMQLSLGLVSPPVNQGAVLSESKGFEHEMHCRRHHILLSLPTWAAKAVVVLCSNLVRLKMLQDQGFCR